ncbi:MAG: hypothetical protein ACKVZ0_02890 [Gemmatimonadales bacterium]
MIRVAVAGLILGASVATGAAAQGDCFPAKSSNEAKTFAIFSVPLAFAPAGVPSTAAGRIQLGIELSYLPNVDPATATPTVCRPGKGPENTDLLFAAPRPRITIGLGGGFAFEGSWTPPARLGGVKANLVGVALSYHTGLGQGGTRLALRAHGSFGQVNAAITCPDAALADPVSECYQGTRSDDRYRPNIVGAEAMVHWSGTVRPYLGLGVNRLMPRFQVHFVNRQNQLDDRKVEVDLDRLALFGGLSWQASRRWALSGEVYTTPSDAVTVRTAIRVGL